MSKRLVPIVTVLLLLSVIPLSTTSEANDNSDLSITAILTVEGEIQTNDPWTTGSTHVNEWAKPMYYIWFDDNGNPEDGRYGNGAGPFSAQVNLDTGRLGVRWFGENGIWGDSDDYTNWPIAETSSGSGRWTCGECGISASILDDGHSLSVTFPLELIGSPDTLEVSAMASPWTSSAYDNTGSGAGMGGWIVISDTYIENSYSLEDAAIESLTWPSELSNSELGPNFNIQSLQVIVGGEAPVDQEITMVSTNPPLVPVSGPDVSVEVTNGFDESKDVNVNATVTQLSTGDWLHWEDVDISLTSGGSQEVTFDIPYSFLDNVPIKVDWTATYEMGMTTQFTTYTDYVITTVDTTVNDSQGYFVIIDNEDDYNSSLGIDWDHLNPEFQDSVVTSTDGKVHMVIVNYSAHHSPLDVDFSSMPVVGNVNASSLMGLKGTADTVVGVAQKAGKIESPMLNKLGVISAGVDLSYITIQSLDCILTEDNCPEDDWEAFDMFVTWTLSAAIVGGTALALTATSPAWAPTLVAAATTASVAYGTGKLLAPLVKHALEAEANGSYIPEDVTYVSTHRSVFMETDPTDYQMSTGFCNVVASCDSDTVEGFGHELSADLMENYPDQDLEDWNVTGVNTAPLMNFIDGDPEGTLHFFELENEETGDTTISPFIIEDQGMNIVYHGEQPEPTFQYEVNIDPNTYQGTYGTPDYAYQQGSQIELNEPNGQGDLDLHVYVGEQHIGMNYETGEVENQVPGAWYSGDTDTTSFSEMVVLPEDVDDYRIAVNAEGAEHPQEDYQVRVVMLDDQHVMAEMVDERQIGQGELKEYTIHESTEGEEFDIDATVPGDDGSDDLGLWIGMIVGVAVIALLVGIVVLRRKRY